MRPSDALFSAHAAKALDRTAEDLESAAARHGLSVTAIHDLAPGLAGCRIYEVCHEPCARAAMAREPDAAILLPCRILLRSAAGGTRLTAIRPAALSALLPGLEDLAAKITGLMETAVSEAAR